MNNPLVQPDPGLFFWTILTFLVLFFLLARYAWKPLLALLEKREETIRRSLDDAERAKEELERLQRESEEIIAKARAEAQTLIAESKSVAGKLRDELLQESRNKAETILGNAKRQIEVEKDQAIKDIKTEVVNLSLQVASKLIARNLTKEENMAFIQESLDKANRVNEA